MVFSSLTFLYFFLPICLALYFAIKNPMYRNIVLVIMSLLFYGWGEPVFIALMLFSSVFNFVIAIMIDKHKNTFASKLCLIVSVVGNLLILGVFKYTDFFISNINVLLTYPLPLLHLVLPIGISFYTFQTMSYTIDVYREEVKVQKSLTKLILYVSLFPQLIAGPIVRYKDIECEIENRNISMKSFSSGITRFCVGLGKKVLIANSCGSVVNLILASGSVETTILGTWFGILMFAMQIYFDFGGYSDMAIGLGRMLGFTYKENFDYPYISKSATEFWRRWHISLGSFFRDYLYIPLGGNKKFWLRNIVIVWFLTGLWHGASWNFIFWGLYYGALLILEKKVLKRLFDKIPSFFSYIYMFFVTLFGWTLFYFTDMNALATALKTMFFMTDAPLASHYVADIFGEQFFILLFAIIFSLPVVPMIKRFINDKIQCKTYIFNILEGLVNIAIIVISTITLVGQTYNPFLYFRF